MHWSATCWHCPDQLGLMDLSSEIESNEQAAWRICTWVFDKGGPRSCTLRYCCARACREPERERVAVDLLLDTEGKSRPVDAKVTPVHECRNDFSEERDCRSDVDCQTKAHREGVDAGKIQDVP